MSHRRTREHHTRRQRQRHTNGSRPCSPQQRPEGPARRPAGSHRVCFSQRRGQSALKAAPARAGGRRVRGSSKGSPFPHSASARRSSTPRRPSPEKLNAFSLLHTHHDEREAHAPQQTQQATATNASNRSNGQRTKERGRDGNRSNLNSKHPLLLLPTLFLRPDCCPFARRRDVVFRSLLLRASIARESIPKRGPPPRRRHRSSLSIV